MDDDFNFSDEELERPTSRTLAQAWVRKIDEEHCAITLGDYDEDGPEVQARLVAIGAAIKAVEFFGRDARNIPNEGRVIQIIFCIAYRLNLKR